MEELKCFLEDPENSVSLSSRFFFCGVFPLVFENVITCFVIVDNYSIAMEQSSERGHLYFIQPMGMVAEM